MILVDGHPISNSNPNSSPSSLLASLLSHPHVAVSSSRLAASPPLDVSSMSSQNNIVYVFQKEYATVDPARVQFVGTDEATTCVGLVIRSRSTGMTSISHMDFPGVVDKGLAQMLSSFNDHEASLDVYLIGGFNDASKDHESSMNALERKRKQEYSLPLCAKIVQALHSSDKMFNLHTLCVLGHNTKEDSYGHAQPIVGGFLVDTSSGSVMPANFDRNSREPDEIVRRIRVTVSSLDPSWKGRLLKTYDTQYDRFEIAPCIWSPGWSQYASSLVRLSDSEVLSECSTSPYAEGPDFVENERRIWNYLINNPDWQQTFPRKQPRVFDRAEEGGWLRRM